MKTLIYFLIMLISSSVGEGIEEKGSKCSYSEVETSFEPYYVLPESGFNCCAPASCEDGIVS